MLFINLFEVVEFAHMSSGNCMSRYLQSILLPDVKINVCVVQSKIDIYKCFNALGKERVVSYTSKVFKTPEYRRGIEHLEHTLASDFVKPLAHRS